MRIEMPYGWRPRVYQEAFWAAMEAGKRRGVLLWHRRTGKDLSCINWEATQSVQRRGLYWHLMPTYAQGRKVIWEGMDRDGRPFLSAFPDELIERKRDDEMTMWLKNGSIFQVVGTDHIDRLMGANPVGLVLSEDALQNPQAWELLAPILAENKGFALFPYTPRGRNHGYDLFKHAQDHPETWFSEKLTVDDTQIIQPEVLEEERERMPKELFEQEYHCSFEASLVGAYYKEQLAWMVEQEPPRISDEVNWIPDREVITGWDIGMWDSTAIWFAQVIGREVRLIDYFEASGQPIDYYAAQMRDKPYVYGDAYLPHDATHQSLETGRTIVQQLRNLRVRAIGVPKMGLGDQHQMVRLMLRQAWIHETKCKRGIQALREYTKRPVEGERGPSGEILYQDRPLHNWASHGASALATLFAGFREERTTEFRQPDAGYVT
jgi:hypothetical protein